MKYKVSISQSIISVIGNSPSPNLDCQQQIISSTIAIHIAVSTIAILDAHIAAFQLAEWHMIDSIFQHHLKKTKFLEFANIAYYLI